MKNWLRFSSAAILAALAPAAFAGGPRAELDAFWATVSQAVAVGDFATYAACCHPDGVLVSEAKGLSQPFAAAFERWKPEFADTRAGRMAATVEFRFTRRLGDATSAHETGIFRYTSKIPGAAARIEHVPFEALIVKRDGRWLMLMELQKAHVNAAEWDALALLGEPLEPPPVSPARSPLQPQGSAVLRGEDHLDLGAAGRHAAFEGFEQQLLVRLGALDR